MRLREGPVMRRTPKMTQLRDENRNKKEGKFPLQILGVDFALPWLCLRCGLPRGPGPHPALPAEERGAVGTCAALRSATPLEGTALRNALQRSPGG
jgi:hypothetical protein